MSQLNLFTFLNELIFSLDEIFNVVPCSCVVKFASYGTRQQSSTRRGFALLLVFFPLLACTRVDETSKTRFLLQLRSGRRSSPQFRRTWLSAQSRAIIRQKKASKIYITVAVRPSLSLCSRLLSIIMTKATKKTFFYWVLNAKPRPQ